MDVEVLRQRLAAHQRWLDGEDGGQRADLRGAELRCADLWDADLRGADLQGADLQGADLRGADLRGADLRGADLQGADLQGADLRCAILQGADLRGAGVRVAHLTYSVFATPTHIQIGCRRFTHDQWHALTEQNVRETYGEHAVQTLYIDGPVVNALIQAVERDLQGDV